MGLPTMKTLRTMAGPGFGDDAYWDALHLLQKFGHEAVFLFELMDEPIVVT